MAGVYASSACDETRARVAGYGGVSAVFCGFILSISFGAAIVDCNRLFDAITVSSFRGCGYDAGVFLCGIDGRRGGALGVCVAGGVSSALEYGGHGGGGTLVSVLLVSTLLSELSCVVASAA